MVGQKIGNWNIILDPTADDFMGLVYRFLAEGKMGDDQWLGLKKT